jgi:Fibronectin type III domain
VQGLIALIRTALVAAGAVLSLAMLVPSTASATHLTETGSPEGPTVPWGFNEFWGFSEDGTWSGEQADHEIELANAIMPRALSAHRFFVQWRRVVFTPKPPNEYDWSVTDRAYQAMQGAEPERKPVMVIHDAPDWARDPTATCPVAACTYPPDPDHYDDWQQFVQDAVSRYPNVRAVEVWNEPNRAQFWGPAPDPGRYVEVLALAHDAVAAAGIDVPVIIGGLGPIQSTTATRTSSREFLREIYNRGGADDFEGIGTHEYPTTEPLVDDMWHEINRLFAVRDNHDDPGTPLWNTEVSVSSDTTEGFGPERQGTELIRLHRSLEGHDIRSFIIYRFHDTTDNTPMWNHTGVVDQSLAPKPAYCELGAVIGVACDTSDTTPPAPPSSLTAAAGNGQVTLDWADNAAPDLAGYRVYRRNSDGTWPSTPVASPIASSFTDTGLANGTTYTYRVTAYDSSGNESAASTETSATPGPVVKSYQPAGYALVSGSVYSGRGAVSRLYSNDGIRVEISAARVGRTYVAEIQPYATITTAERASLKKLSVEYDGNASSNSAAVTLRIRNFQTGQWETLDGPRTGVTTDRNFKWSNSTAPTDYVSGSGEVRFAVRGTRSSGFQTRTDLISFTIES